MKKKIIEYLGWIIFMFFLGLVFTIGIRTGHYLWPEKNPDLVVKHQWEMPIRK